MSYSRYYLFGVDGSVLEDRELRNGHGAGPVIWDHLSRSRWGGEVSWYMGNDERFWDPTEYNTVNADLLRSTFDGALVPREGFVAFVAALRTMEVDPSHVNHWPAICEWISAQADNERVLGLGIYHTSVGDDPWHPWVPDEHDGGEYELIDPRHAPHRAFAPTEAPAPGPAAVAPDAAAAGPEATQR